MWEQGTIHMHGKQCSSTPETNTPVCPPSPHTCGPQTLPPVPPSPHTCMAFMTCRLGTFLSTSSGCLGMCTSFLATITPSLNSSS